MVITLKQLLYARYLIPGFRVLSSDSPFHAKTKKALGKMEASGLEFEPLWLWLQRSCEGETPRLCLFLLLFLLLVLTSIVLALLFHSVLGSSSWSMHRCLQCSWGHRSLVEGIVKSVVLGAQSCGDLSRHCRSGTALNQAHSHRKGKSWGHLLT